MTVCILVLHIYRLGERFDHLTNEGLVLFILLHECIGTLVYIPLNKLVNKESQQAKTYHDKPGCFIESGFLVYRNHQSPALTSGHRILKLHDEPVVPALQIIIISRLKIGSVYRSLLLVNALQIIGYLRVDKRIGKYITAYGKLVHVRRKDYRTVMARIDAFTVNQNIGNSHLHIVNIIKIILYIHLGHSCGPRNIEISFLR